MVEAASPIFVNNPAAIRGKDVLVVEDGTTLTHGEMAYGASIIAQRASARLTSSTRGHGQCA